MKFQFLIFVISMLCYSCNKSESSSTPDANFDCQLEFTFEDDNGNDLLNPDVTNSFKHEELKVYCLYNGVEKKIATSESANFISKERGFYTLSINLASDTTYLKLSEIITDTITRECRFGSNYQYLIKIWYNNKIVWEKEDETALVQIIKMDN